MDAKRVSEKNRYKSRNFILSKKFRSEVIDSFIDSYAAGKHQFHVFNVIKQ